MYEVDQRAKNLVSKEKLEALQNELNDVKYSMEQQFSMNQRMYGVTDQRVKENSNKIVSVYFLKRLLF